MTTTKAMQVSISTEEKAKLAHDVNEAKTLLEDLVGNVSVDDDESFELAAKLLIEVKRQVKGLDERRKSVTGPLNESLRVVNSWFKPALSALEKAEKELKEQVGGYIVDLYKHNEKQALAAATAETYDQAEAAATAMAKIPKIKGVSVTERWSWEVVDEELLPRDLLTLDDDVVKALVDLQTKEGEPPVEVPGLRFYKEPRVTVRT